MKPKQNDGRGLDEAGAKPRCKRHKPSGATPAILKGKFFHSFEEGRVQWQGCVLGSPSPGYYLVQLFSWLSGEQTNQQIVPFEKMTDWYFYDSSEELKYSWEHGSTRRFREAMEQKAAREYELRFGKLDKQLLVMPDGLAKLP
jgi:hypothetical protein